MSILCTVFRISEQASFFPLDGNSNKHLMKIIDYMKCCNKIISTFDEQRNYFMEKYPLSAYLEMLVVDEMLRNYGNRVKTLRLNIMMLQIPILIMLAFYIFMISQLLIEHEKMKLQYLKAEVQAKYRYLENIRWKASS